MRRLKRNKKEFEIKLEQEFPFMRRKEVTEEQWEKGGYMTYDAYRCQCQEGITHILTYAFAGQLHLRSVTVPASVTEIGEGTFDGCHKNLLLRCHENSYAFQYATTNGFTCELISP